MFIFITSVIVVSFICYCFFKKKFWENRYLVLTISAGVALVVTLTTNYVIRGKLTTKIETVWTEPIQVMSFNDSLLVDSFALTTDKELKLSQHLTQGDTTLVPTYSHYLLYYYGGSLKIGYAQNDDLNYKYWEDIYIASSGNDTVAYYTKEKQYYDSKPNRWLADFSLPVIQTIKCFYLPPSEFAAIPDSLIRELPF